MAWGIYLLAVVAAQILCWRVTRPLPWADLRLVIQIVILAVTITPVRLQPADSYWAPAFMAALMDGLNYGSEQAIKRLSPILVTMLVMLSLSFAWKLFKAYRKTDARSDQGTR